MNWILSHLPAWNSWLALLLYWLPLVLCAYGYTVRGVSKYREELTDRRKHEATGAYFHPQLTVGHIVGHVLLAASPIANLFAATFDVAPEVFGDFFSWMGKVLDQPLVPRRKPPTPAAQESEP